MAEALLFNRFRLYQSIKKGEVIIMSNGKEFEEKIELLQKEKMEAVTGSEEENVKAQLRDLQEKQTQIDRNLKIILGINKGSKEQITAEQIKEEVERNGKF